ncbi:MAG TPA: FAD-dependent monooxygenase [Pirellulales bacterium]|jgi:2-polyprenyl-6-methoxyphenol hydroxylase-like FAD-dependent oxidoreductase
MSEDTLDALIVGAGPVGLMMAAELRRHGVACRLIERLAEPAPFCKALGVTPRTLEMWDDLGIAGEALTAGEELRGLASIANGVDVEISDVELKEGAYGFLTLAQYDAERLLTEHLHRLGGCIEREVEFVALEQSPDAVSVRLRRADGAEDTAQARYLVGCDGGRSAVRHALGLSFEGDHYEQTFMLADVELDWSLERGYAYKLARIENDQIRAAGACIPAPGNPRRYRFSTIAPQELIPKETSLTGVKAQWASDTGPTLAQIQETLDYLYPPGARASQMRWSTFYRVSHRIVPRYRVGRVFLAGDAAHLHPPLGGQGMNTGLQDAYNLAWKLALDLRRLANSDLLESYDAERRAIGQQIVDRTTKRMNALFAGEVDPQEPVREDSQLFLNYRESPWSSGHADGGKGPLSGDRAPDAVGLRRANVRYDLRLFDLFRGPHHTLLAWCDGPDAVDGFRKLAKVSEVLHAKLPNLFRAYALTSSAIGKPSQDQLAILHDTRGEFARQYAPRNMEIFLVRPDGYVGYRAGSLELDNLTRHLAKIFKL